MNRRRIDTDRRRIQFTLTEEGQRVCCETEKELNVIIGKIISNYDEEKLNAFIKMADEFVDLLKQIQIDLIKD